MIRDLTKGNVMKAMIMFSLPMIAGNLLQQLYNVVDTLIVGKVLGSNALAAVGSAYTLMVFLTSISLGFCMGGGVVFAQLFGAKRMDDMKVSIVNAFVFIALATLLLMVLSFIFLGDVLQLLNIKGEVYDYTYSYLRVILCGLPVVYIFNFFTAVLRSIGNSFMPLVFLGVAAVTNIVLDIIFVLPFGWGVAGSAWATVIAQCASAILVTIYFFYKAGDICPSKEHFHIDKPLLKSVIGNSVLTSIQQSVMNLGILMVQGLVNSFGVAVMAAFAAAVKIDAFAYMPVQDFGNAFSTFIAQNYGAKKEDRIMEGIRYAIKIAMVCSVIISLVVFLIPEQLMLLFVNASEVEVISIGATYLRIEGAFYCLIAGLFLLYGFYRGLGRSGMSIVLTVVSLGTRVALAYALSSSSMIGLVGIWWAIPIGWLIADVIGVGYYLKNRRTLLEMKHG